MKTILIILLLILNIAVNATTYYVATNGNDSRDTVAAQNIDTPWLTWQHAAENAYPGDTIYIRGGIYYLTGVRPWIYIKPNDPYAPIGRSGTSVNKIYMWAYPPDYAAGNIPILDCKDAYHDNPTNFSALNFDKAEYWHVKGLTIRNNYQRTSSFLPQGIGCEGCANMVFENCTVHNISGRGFYYTSGFYNEWDDEEEPTLFECDTTYFINCDAYNLCDSVSSNPGNAADGFKAGSYQNGYLSFSGCRAWNYSDDGFDVHGNGIRTFDHCWAMSTHKYVSFGMEGNGYKFTGRGLQAWYGDAPTYPLVRMTNCLAAYCYYTGIYNNLYNIEGPDYGNNNGLFLNNTSYECGRGVSEGYTEADPHIGGWYNNISYCPSSINPYGWPYNVEMPWYASDDYAESHNTWDYSTASPYWVATDTVTINNDDFISLDSSQIRLPRKYDGSLPDIDFLKLKPTSDLVNKGTNVGLDYYGVAPDIGYSEYTPGPQIIADHSIVDDYDKIPQYYIDSIKKMWLVYPGESHAFGIVWGLEYLESKYPEYAVNRTTSGTPEAYTDQHLRASVATWGDHDNASGWIYDYGEEDWWTNALGISRTKAAITYANSNSLDISAIGFGWCWDHTYDGVYNSPTSGVDPVYGVHWYGRSNYSPSGWMYESWGIDADDFAVTNNAVSMDTYLAATQSYINYCDSAGYNTKVFFTTAPVDDYEGNIPTESLYQGYLKNEHIRDYVNSDTTLILFDYADILCYDNNGTLATDTWNDNTFPTITNTNYYPINWGHISDIGIERIAKAMWWMLARMAGWDGNVTVYSEEEVDSTATDILTFTLAEQTGAATINTTNHTVSIEVDYTADITDLTPTITLSYGATIIPASGVSRDFTSPLPYTVTALDGVTYQEWTVTVTQEDEPEPEPVETTGSIVKFAGKIVKR